MEFKKGEIEGVVIEKLIKFSDERGSLVETFRIDNLSDNLQPVMSYVSYTRPGVARGPHEHLKQTDIFCFMGPGNFRIKLWDNRKESRTYGYCIEIIGGEDNPIMSLRKRRKKGEAFVYCESEEYYQKTYSKTD
jgi:dTDP-4-dehydrorhamnose 3,5-epimerase